MEYLGHFFKSQVAKRLFGFFSVRYLLGVRWLLIKHSIRGQTVGTMVATAVPGSPVSINLSGPDLLLETEARG